MFRRGFTRWLHAIILYSAEAFIVLFKGKKNSMTHYCYSECIKSGEIRMVVDGIEVVGIRGRKWKDGAWKGEGRKVGK